MRNRRRIRGARGQAADAARGERIERPFAHLYETGGMRRTHLRGHANILKRLLMHAGGFNLGLLMRTLIGVGTPRGLQGRALALFGCLWSLLHAPERLWDAIWTCDQPFTSPDHLRAPRTDRRIDLTVTNYLRHGLLGSPIIRAGRQTRWLMRLHRRAGRHHDTQKLWTVMNESETPDAKDSAGARDSG